MTSLWYFEIRPSFTASYLKEIITHAVFGSLSLLRSKIWIICHMIRFFQKKFFFFKAISFWKKIARGKHNVNTIVNILPGLEHVAGTYKLETYVSPKIHAETQVSKKLFVNWTVRLSACRVNQSHIYWDEVYIFK